MRRKLDDSWLFVGWHRCSTSVFLKYSSLWSSKERELTSGCNVDDIITLIVLEKYALVRTIWRTYRTLPLFRFAAHDDRLFDDALCNQRWLCYHCETEMMRATLTHLSLSSYCRTADHIGQSEWGSSTVLSSTESTLARLNEIYWNLRKKVRNERFYLESTAVVEAQT